MYHQATGKTIILIGIGILTIGIIWYFFGNKLHFIGRLPGDIRVERPSFRFYFPVTTMILFSLLLSAMLYIIKKFL